jgi:transposase-like protein
MMINKENSLLEILSEYKWGEAYTCYKCRHNAYKKGKQYLSRKCKMCDYDESVQKFTAFEGTKDIVKAHDIINYIYDNCIITDYDKEVIVVESKGQQEEHDILLTKNFNEGELISFNTLVSRYANGNISKSLRDRLIVENIKNHKLNISEIARVVGLEENSVYRFLTKIDERLRMTKEFNNDNPVENIFYTLCDTRWNRDYLLGLLMIPLDSIWNKLKKEINGRHYEICEPRGSLRLKGNFRWMIEEC